VFNLIRARPRLPSIMRRTVCCDRKWIRAWLVVRDAT
jgi:hypothetical protein